MTDPTVQVFDPPMCCSTGACGPEADPDLARFAADLKWLEGRGVRVERYNLGREPQVFAQTPAVADAFRRRSISALPLVLVGDRTLREGGYPSRAELARALGVPVESTSSGGLRLAVDPGCTPGSGCCG